MSINFHIWTNHVRPPINRALAVAALSLLAARAPAASDGTVIGNLAESLQPGQWGELQTVGAHAAFSADTSIFEYADKMVWDSIGKQALFYGSSDPGGSQNHKFIRYQASTNTWTVLPNPPWAGSQTIAHSYKHQAVDVANRRLYYRVMGFDNREFWSVSLDNLSGGWTQRASVDNIPGVQDASALDFFHARGTIVLHSGDVGNGSGLVEYVASSNSWRAIPGVFAPEGGLHSIIECNPVHNLCVFGGGDLTRRIWRLNADLSTAPIADAPFGDFSTRFAEIAHDPATGDFLVVKGTQFWRFDGRGTGTWTVIASGGAVPPFSGFSDNVPSDHAVMAPIDTYGVIMYAQWRDSGSKVWLYKNGAGGALDTVAPRPPTSFTPD